MTRQGVPITKLGLCQCRYPIEGTESPILFCGEFARDPNRPWCETHYPMVYESRAMRKTREERRLSERMQAQIAKTNF